MSLVCSIQLFLFNNFRRNNFLLMTLFTTKTYTASQTPSKYFLLMWHQQKISHHTFCHFGLLVYVFYHFKLCLSQVQIMPSWLWKWMSAYVSTCIWVWKWLNFEFSTSWKFEFTKGQTRSYWNSHKSASTVESNMNIWGLWSVLMNIFFYQDGLVI